MKKKYVGYAVILMALVGGEAILLNLTHWQYTRHGAAQEKQAQRAAMQTLAPVAPDEVHSTGQRVVLTGRFDPTREVVIENAHLDGKRGYGLATPLVLENGKEIIVNRGFVQAPNIVDNLAQFAPEERPYTLTGTAYFNAPQEGWLKGPVYSTHPKLFTRMNVREMPAKDGTQRYRFYVVSHEGVGENVAAFPALPTYEIPHRQYMFTWGSLAVIWPLLFAWAAFSARRKRRATPEA